MLKCVWSPCDKEVEYIYLGKSLCAAHFKLTVKEAMPIQERLQKRKAGSEEKPSASEDVKTAYDSLSNARFKLNAEGKVNPLAKRACLGLDRIIKALRPMKEDLTHAGY
jgi:hypothetical protein